MKNNTWYKDHISELVDSCLRQCHDLSEEAYQARRDGNDKMSMLYEERLMCTFSKIEALTSIEKLARL